MVEDLVDGAGEVTHCGQGGVAAEVFQLKDEVRGRASPSTQVQTISVGSCLFSPWPEHCSFSSSIDQPRTDLIWTLQPGFGQKKDDLISTAAAIKDAITERLLFGGLD